MTTTTSGLGPILEEIAGNFEDLADPVQVEPWRLLTIDTTRGRSRNRELYHPCYILVDFCAFRSFGLRPHGLIEVVLGKEEFSFPTVLPMELTWSYLEISWLPCWFLPAGISVVWSHVAKHGGSCSVDS